MAENRCIYTRRTGKDHESAPPPRNVVGLALSGGGIRSATVSLGVVQGLAKAGILPFIDYISTVSGGGYLGTFLGGLFQRWTDVETGQPVAAQAVSAQAGWAGRWEPVRKALSDRRGHPIDWLRENGRYLAPNGAGDLSLAVAVVLRNLIAFHIVLGMTFLTALLATNGLRHGLAKLFEHYAFEASASVRSWLVGAEMWWSSLFVVPVAVVLLWALPAGIAYWLIQSDERDGRSEIRDASAPVLTMLGLIVFGVAAWATAGRFPDDYHPRAKIASVILFGLSVPAVVYWCVARVRFRERSAQARNFLTRRLRSGMLVAAGTAVFALMDSLGQTIYVRWQGTGSLSEALKWVGAGIASVVSISTVIQRVGGVLTEGTSKRPKLPMSIIAAIGAVVLVGAMLVSLATLAHWLTWVSPGRPVGGLCGQGQARHLCTPSEIVPLWFVGVLVIGLGLTVAFGWTYSFVNRSSLAALYGDRLARAYLGASNPERRKTKEQGLGVLLPGDDIDLRDYRPHTQGGPLHLINVTVNETTAGRSQVEQRDRKGMGMTIGPAGVSVGVRHHAARSPTSDELVATKDPVHGFRVFPQGTVFPRWPTIGRWMAISGAAVSTGLGSRTSLSLSILIGLFNLRLGQWWRSGVDPKLRAEQTKNPSTIARFLAWLAGAFPVQSHMLSELLARFPGTSAKDWYLTDGGHFENTGAYELIRRRVPFIILCSNGADADRMFDDLGNLTRKARTDFGASINFLRRAELSTLPKGADCIGTLEDLGFKAGEPTETAAPSRETSAGDLATRARRYAALARITYDGTDQPTSTLLFLRPAVLGSEPADVLSYHAQNPTFPQQSTGDQFFDEAQWEAYRRLGEEIASTVFASIRPTAGDTPAEGWFPVFLAAAATVQPPSPAPVVPSVPPPGAPQPQPIVVVSAGPTMDPVPASGEPRKQ